MPEINIEPNKKKILGKDKDGCYVFGNEEPLEKADETAKK